MSLLDDLFGVARLPQSPALGVPPIKAHEYAYSNGVWSIRQPRSLATASSQVLAQLDPKTLYIWIVDMNGEVVLAIEENLGGQPSSGQEQTLGHPTLVNGQPARIGGEMHCINGRWIITNKSGRYGKNRPDADQLLANVSDVFRGMGLNVTCQRVW